MVTRAKKAVSGAPAAASDTPAQAGSQAAPAAVGKLSKLKIWNFRTIGPAGVEIELDDIVVLVGENNAGKSSILRALELALNAEDAKRGKLALEDFFGAQPPPEAGPFPCIEIETCFPAPAPTAQHWRLEGGKAFLRERFTWRTVDGAAERETFLPGDPASGASAAGGWATGVDPYGAPNVRKGKRPKPFRIDAFASPDKQRENLEELLRAPVDRAAELLLGDAASEGVKQLKSNIQSLREAVRQSANDQLKLTSDALSADLARVFPAYRVDLHLPEGGDELKEFDLFAGGLVPRMGIPGQFQSTIDRQGAGAQRALLWSVLRYLAAVDKEIQPGRGKVLLLDEPELCLHPTAIRAACNALYSLADGGHGWQVMVTTHAPSFIDLARDHTTIVRLARGTDPSAAPGATTLFRSDRAEFSGDARAQLKLLNTYDPYVAEFFFGGRSVIVEGDTEYAAFRRIVAERPDLSDVHVIRARGKYLIVLLATILNQFKAPYAVLHDFDHPKLTKGKKAGDANPAWAANERIRAVCEASQGKARLVGAVENFEEAVFGSEQQSDKPYEAVRKLEGDPNAFAAVEALLRALLGLPSASLPPTFRLYASTKDLESIRSELLAAP